MTRAWLCLAVLLLATRPLAAAETLTYHGEAGRVAEYRLTLTATGYQVSLGVRKAVRLEAKYVLREQVLSVDPDGSLYLQLSGRVITWKDKTGAFAGGRVDLPATQVHLSPRGEVLGVTPVAEGNTANLRARAGAALFAQPLPVLLPEAPVEVGATWEWEKDGAAQTNRLAGLTAGDQPTARLTSTGHTPIVLHDASEALGLTVEVTGQEAQTSTLEFSPGLGLARRHKGNADLETKTQVDMETAEGTKTFPMELKVRVSFDLRLTRVDGKPV